MKEVVWLVGFLVVAYVVVWLLVFLKKKTGGRGEKWVVQEKRGDEGEGGKIAAVLIAGVTAYEEEGAVKGKKRSGRIVRDRKEEGFSLWRAMGRTG